MKTLRFTIRLDKDLDALLTKDSLRQAIELILEDRKTFILRGLPEDAIRDTVKIG